jgi:transposase-like protein
MAIRKELLDELLKDYKGPDDFYGPDGIMKQLSKALIERMMEAELTEQLGYEKSESGEKKTSNRRNGKTSKTLRTDQGSMEIEVPRDRNGEFEPIIIPKHQREWRGFDDKILSMYSLGLSTKAIQENIKEIYNVDISPELVSRVTDEVKGLVEEWRNRPLDSFYPVVFFDALRVNIRDEGHVSKKAIYLALAIRLDGQKEILGMWIERNEGSSDFSPRFGWVYSTN